MLATAAIETVVGNREQGRTALNKISSYNVYTNYCVKQHQLFVLAHGGLLPAQKALIKAYYDDLVAYLTTPPPMGPCSRGHAIEWRCTRYGVWLCACSFEQADVLRTPEGTAHYPFDQPREPIQQIQRASLGYKCQICHYHEAVVIWKAGKYYCPSCYEQGQATTQTGDDQQRAEKGEKSLQQSQLGEKSVPHKGTIKHAVLTDEEIYLYEQGRVIRRKLTTRIDHIADLYQVAATDSITHWWILPNSRIAALGWQFLDACEDYKIFIPGERDEENEPHAASCKKASWKKDTFEIQVMYPDNAFRWIANDPVDILASIDYLARAVGVEDIKYSPQHIGKLLLKRQYAATETLRSLISKPETDLSNVPFRQAGKEIYFARALTPVMESQYYHLYDKNSAHPSAASSMVTGLGSPIHVEGDTLVPYLDLKNAGIYRVTFSPGSSPFDGKRLPSIIDSEWVPRDVLKFALKQGYSVTIHEAYIFEHARVLFGDWARDLWAARQALRDEGTFKHQIGRENAYYTIKEILNHSISAMTEHPNWWSDMLGAARVARLANIAKFATENGPTPLYVYVDDMAYVSSEEDPARAVQGIFERKTKTGEIIDNRTELGGYKHKFSIKITREMIEDLAPLAGRDHKQAASKLHAYFKRAAKKEGMI